MRYPERTRRNELILRSGFLPSIPPPKVEGQSIREVAQEVRGVKKELKKRPNQPPQDQNPGPRT